MANNSESKSRELKQIEKKLDMQIKQNSEELIKEKLNKKELDYDTISLLLEIFQKSKFRWKDEHFENFKAVSDKFMGRSIPKNNRECVMLGMRLGTMRSKMIYNLKGRQISEIERKAMDDLLWNFVWNQWQRAKILYEHSNTNEK